MHLRVALALPVNKVLYSDVSMIAQFRSFRAALKISDLFNSPLVNKVSSNMHHMHMHLAHEL